MSSIRPSTRLKVAKVVKWLWEHTPTTKGRACQEVERERAFWKSMYMPMDKWLMKNQSIMVHPKTYTIKLVGPMTGVESEFEVGVYAGRYYLDYRFFAVKDSLSDVVRQHIAREIHDEILRVLRGMKT